MSWVLGSINGNEIESNNYKNLIYNKLYEYNSRNIRVIAGGYSNNIFFNETNKNEGWIVCGTGLKTENTYSTILDKSDWSKFLSNPHLEDKINQLGGHFVIVRWDSDKISFYSDTLGLRDIYLIKHDDEILFSTRIDWLGKLVNLDLDIETFSSRWRLFNQLSHNSIFKNVERVVAGRYAYIDLNNELKISFKEVNRFSDTDSRLYDVESFNGNLKSLVNIKLPQEKKLSLSLSGGMDSRVILSYLLNNDEAIFDTHTFGDPEHPDSLIAEKIALDYSFEHQPIDLINYSIDSLITQMRDYAARNLVNNSASSIIQLNNYNQLSGKNYVIIDGGFGEIWRREFFYKLYLQGKDSLLKGNVDGVIPFLQHNRADIFSEEVNLKMYNGLRNQVSEIFELLPSINKNNIENWLDEFAIKTRLTNFYSHEQSRLDHYVTSVMPFIQPSLLKNIWRMPINLRKNGKLFRSLIKLNSNTLIKYPLAKGASSHPFIFNSIQSRIWSILQRKLGFGIYHNNRLHKYFADLKEYVYDISTSDAARNYPLYDYKKVRKIIDGYYEGNKSLVSTLDWWLTFELFRQHYFSDRQD